MTRTEGPNSRRRQVADLVVWAAAGAVGLGVVLLTARHLPGTHAAPFLGAYRFSPDPWLLLAAAVAAGTLLAHRYAERLRFGALQAACYLAALCWSLALAAGTGLAGRLADAGAAAGDPLRYLREFTTSYATGASGHPPGPGLLLWALREAGLAQRPALVAAVTALGALAVPLTLAAVRNSAGDAAGRRYAPVLVLAPYLMFLGGSMDGVAAALGAGMAAAGARASAAGRTGRRATGWALLAGLLLGLASMFSYAAPWLGLSVVFLYFARRRPFLPVATGLGALVVPVAGAAAGFSWLSGLLGAHSGYPHRPASALLWGPVSLVVLLLCCGPPLVAGLRKMRNTPGWPFLAGAGLAVAFSVLAGFARGGTETVWLPFFGWLTLAATAPERQAGPPVPAPLLLTAAGAGTGLLIAAFVVPG